MEQKIFSYPNNHRVWKAQIAGNFTGLQIEAPAFQIGVDNKTPEFAAKFPLQKVPALETPEGPLFESNAIARYGVLVLPPPTPHFLYLSSNLISTSALLSGQVWR